MGIIIAVYIFPRVKTFETREREREREKKEKGKGKWRGKRKRKKEKEKEKKKEKSSSCVRLKWKWKRKSWKKITLWLYFFPELVGPIYFFFPKERFYGGKLQLLFIDLRMPL